MNFIEEHPGLKDKVHKLTEFRVGKVECQRLVNGVIEDLGEYPEDALPRGKDIIIKAKNPNEFEGKTLGYIKDDVVDIQDIHETQIDKIRAAEIIDKFKWAGVGHNAKQELKKVMGLKSK